MACSKGPVNVLTVVFSILAAVIAITIVVYTATQLSDVNISFTNGVQQTQASCLIAKSPTNTSSAYVNSAVDAISNLSSTNCLMLEILGGLTIGVAILIAILQCCTCNFCGLGGLVDFIFDVAGLAAWIAASAVVTTSTNGSSNFDTNAANNLTYRRNAIEALCWIEAGLFLILVLLSLFKCCCCCGNKKAEDEDDQFVSKTDVEAATAAPAQATIPPAN